MITTKRTNFYTIIMLRKKDDIEAFKEEKI